MLQVDVRSRESEGRFEFGASWRPHWCSCFSCSWSLWRLHHITLGEPWPSATKEETLMEHLGWEIQLLMTCNIHYIIDNVWIYFPFYVTDICHILGIAYLITLSLLLILFYMGLIILIIVIEYRTFYIHFFSLYFAFLSFYFVKHLWGHWKKLNKMYHYLLLL